ncbi:MAG: alpha/beta fold hydrolase [Pseudomonadota bacterium]
MIEPFLLSDGGPDLCVTYHPASTSISGGAVVLCAPFFLEFQRVQLCLRELAISLAASGQHCFRFDYRGCGDSSGDESSATLRDWVDDLARVVNEARDLSGSEQVHLIGVRAASLVIGSALDQLGALGNVVLWDPVCDGQAHLDALVGGRDAMLARNRWLTSTDRSRAAEDAFGYLLPGKLADDLASAKAADWSVATSASLTAVLTEPADSLPVAFAQQTVKFDCDWLPGEESLLMPQPVLEALRECVLA